MDYSVEIDRRSGQDRRRYTIDTVKRLFSKGTRQSVRRAEDRRRVVAVDRYDSSLFISTMLLLGLSLLDAFLTLLLISRGAVELNPIMEYYLSHGPQTFLLVKYGLTALSVLILVAAKDLIQARCRMCMHIIPIFSLVFGAVVCWELYLLIG